MTDDTVARLNELLEAERAGVETLQALIKTVPKGYFRNHLAKIEADEATSCAVMERAVRAAGGEPSRATGDFTAKVLALDSLAARLKLLSRGQTWVVKRLDAVAESVTDPERRKELAEMRREHVENVEWCDVQVAELEAEAAATSTA
jgi:nitronate monooxygenase